MMGRSKKMLIAFLFGALFLASCAKPLVDARVAEPGRYYYISVNATKDEALDGTRWAMKISGYAISKEDKPTGSIETVWVPIGSDTHYIDVFGRRDYGANGAYHQLVAQVSSEGKSSTVRVGSRTKSIVSYLKSSGVEEKKLLDEIGNYFRQKEPQMSNIGIKE